MPMTKIIFLKWPLRKLFVEHVISFAYQEFLMRNRKQLFFNKIQNGGTYTFFSYSVFEVKVEFVFY
jgi:hypothetical protein